MKVIEGIEAIANTLVGLGIQISYLGPSLGAISIDHEFESYIAHLGYIGIFIWFTTIDQLTPVPEEGTLLTIGYMAANNIFNPLIAGSISLLAFLSVDIVYYFLARSGNKLITKISRGNNKLISNYIDGLKKHMVRSLFILCFIPRMRLFGPILVGSLNLPFKKFLLTDWLALSLFTALYISLGVLFHKTLYNLLKELELLRHSIFILLVMVIVVLIVIWMRKRHHSGLTK